MLHTSFQQGCYDACARFGVKTARGAMGMPAGRPMHPAIAGLHADLHATPAHAPAAPASSAASSGASWADMHKGVAQQQAANVQTRPTELPAARAFEGHGAAAAGGGTGAPGGGGGGGGGGWASRMSSGASQFMRPVKRGLGLAALGGAGALAYGMHRQNVEDREKLPNVHAPMTGTY